jgi:hypothetical protein
MPVVRTYLELTDPAAIRAPAAPPSTDAEITIAKVDPPDGATSRWFYEHVGRDYQWTDNLGRTEAEWQAWAERVETWLLTVDGERAGYHELRPEDGAGVEIAYFGLLAHAPGAGPRRPPAHPRAAARVRARPARLGAHLHARRSARAAQLRGARSAPISDGGAGEWVEICHTDAKILRR